MTSDVSSSGTLSDQLRQGARELSAGWWWFLILGILWIGFGMFVLSYRVGSLTAVAALVGVAFLFGGLTMLVAAARVPAWTWLYIIVGTLGTLAGITTLVWPGPTLYVVAVLLAWFLIIFGIVHIVSALAGAKVPWWWTQLLLGVAELVIGVWAVRSWEASLLALMTLVGVWAIFHGVSEVFAAFSLRDARKQVERAAG
jgi:uncharacterized membrane protein HdeD (DUF308 family)